MTRLWVIFSEHAKLTHIEDDYIHLSLSSSSLLRLALLPPPARPSSPWTWVRTGGADVGASNGRTVTERNWGRRTGG